MLVFDIETDGLLNELTKVHCINIIDRSTGKRWAFNEGVYADGTPAPRDGPLSAGLDALAEADAICGANIINFDIPAIQKVYPWFTPKGHVVDTLVMSRVIYPDVMDRDLRAVKRGRLPHEFQKAGLIGKHSLEAWGWRLGMHKGEFGEGLPAAEKWKHFTPEMDKYARQDPEVTLVLLEKMESKAYSPECLELEHAVATIVQQQVARGFAFDMPAAEQLTAKLQRRHAEIASELQRKFEPWYAADIVKGTALFTPKGDNKKLGYTAGCVLSKVKHVVFNPASRDHIADRLMALRGWKPVAFTPEGKPQVDETILEALPWPEAKVLSEYLMVEKRLGQVANGREAWLKHARKEGDVYRIHGSVNCNGAVTGRMTHSSPNIAQTPAVGALYGEECRACFIASPGLVLVGCDAEGIELRCLAHYMARFDGGAYAETVVNGKKEDETDVHNVNKRAVGLNKRDTAKTWVYALIYGAGDYKLGTIVYDDFTEEQRKEFLTTFRTKSARAGALKKLGEASRARIMKNLPALKKLVEAVKAAVKQRGYLIGLDGRQLHVRAEHSALNTLLQSAGAILMKKALTLLDGSLAPYRSTNGTVAFVANIHDEWQIETTEEIADDIGRTAADAIRRSGEHFKFRCPLAGSFNTGRNWRDTH